MQCWTNEFESLNPHISITYEPALSAKGATDMVNFLADFSPFAREYFPSERLAFQSAFRQQAPLIRVATGSFDHPGKTHALAIYVHRENPLVSLTLQQLRRIFTADTDDLTWGEFGLKGEWASKPIHRFGMLNLRSSDNPPGIVNFMRHRINDGQPLSDGISQLPGDEKVHALQQIVDAVGGDPLAIGYSGFGFVNPGSRPLPLAYESGREAVAGSADRVRTHTYPLSRFVYFALRPDLEPAPRAALADFLAYIHTPAGQDCIQTESTGFYPLPAEVVASSKVEIEHFRTNESALPAVAKTGYLTEDGQLRVVGYNDMEPMLAALNGLFEKLHPEISVELDLRGTRLAPPALIGGSSAFAPMGAEFSVPALQEYRVRYQSDPLEIRVAHAAINNKALSGPLALFVHADNPLETISLDEAAKVFSLQTGIENFTTWGQLGLDGPWARRPIEPCGLKTGTALATYLSEHFFSGAPYSPRVAGFGQSTEAVQFAATHRDALCFAGYNRATSGARALAVSVHKGGTAWSISENHIINGQYPLDRHLYIYLHNLPGTGIDPLVRDYLQIVLSPQGQELISSTPPGYLPLSTADRKAELDKLSPATEQGNR